MGIRLRQICLVALDLKPAVEELCAVFDLSVCHVDSAVGKWGLENALMPIGHNFLEVVGPVREGTAAGRYLERRGGDGGYMVITQVRDKDEHAARRARAEALGVRFAHEMDYGDFQGMQLHPRDTGGCFFEIDHNAGGERDDGPWHPAGADWPSMSPSSLAKRFVAAEIQSPEPKPLAARWSEIAEIPLAEGADGLELPLENAVVRFVAARDGRGEGLGGLDLAVADAEAIQRNAAARNLPVHEDTVTVCGTRFRLLPG